MESIAYILIHLITGTLPWYKDMISRPTASELKVIIENHKRKIINKETVLEVPGLKFFYIPLIF